RIGIPDVKHDLGYILPCSFEKLLGGFYPDALDISNGRIIGSLFKPSFKCPAAGVDESGERLDRYPIAVMFFDIILYFLDIIIVVITLAFEYGELGLAIPADIQREIFGNHDGGFPVGKLFYQVQYQVP